MLTETGDAQQWKDALETTSSSRAAFLLARLVPINLLDTKEAACRKAVQLYETYALCWNDLAMLLFKELERYEEAEAAFRKAIELDSSDPFSRNNLGYLLHSKLGRYEKAEEAYRSSINADEHFERAWNNLAKLLIDHLEKHEEAEVAIRKSITFKESDILWNRLGNLLADYLHKFEEADKCYRRSLELDSDNEAAKQNLVFLLRDQLGKNTEAEELLNEIEPDKSGFPEVISLQRATFALHKENLGDAKLNLQAALEKLDGKFNPNSVDDWYRTAAVWLDFGHGGAWHGVWEETGAALFFMPFAQAVRAHHLGDVRFLNKIPKEVQPAAREIFKEISYRRRETQPFTGKQQSKRPKSK